MLQNNVNEARELQMKSIKTVEVIIKYGGGVRGGKAIMNLLGVKCGNCRLPLKPFCELDYVSLKKDLEGIGFYNF